MPIAIIPRQPGRIPTEDQPHPAKTDLGGELLKAQPLLGGATAFTQILIDYLHPLPRPAQPYGPLH